MNASPLPAGRPVPRSLSRSAILRGTGQLSSPCWEFPSPAVPGPAELLSQSQAADRRTCVQAPPCRAGNHSSCHQHTASRCLVLSLPPHHSTIHCLSHPLRCSSHPLLTHHLPTLAPLLLPSSNPSSAPPSVSFPPPLQLSLIPAISPFPFSSPEKNLNSRTSSNPSISEPAANVSSLSRTPHCPSMSQHSSPERLFAPPFTLPHH